MLKPKGYDLFDLNLQGGSHGWAPLHLAAHNGHIQVAVMLL